MFVLSRGPIDKVDNILPATVAASLVLSEDRKAIIWTIGIDIGAVIYLHIDRCI